MTPIPLPHGLHITADQFLAQCDRTLQELVQQQPTVPSGFTLKLRECFLGVFYAMKAHEHTISALHDDLQVLERYVAAIVRTHGLAPTKQKAKHAAPSSGMIVTGSGSDAPGE